MDGWLVEVCDWVVGVFVCFLGSMLPRRKCFAVTGAAMVTDPQQRGKVIV